MLTISRYENTDYSQWNNFVEGTRNGNFLFNRDYLDYHSDRFVDSSLLVRASGKLSALFPCNVTEDCVITHGGLTYGGLLYGDSFCANNIIKALEAIFHHFREQGKTKLIYKAIPSIFRKFPSDEDLFALTYLGAKLSRRDLSSVVRLQDKIKYSDSRKSTARKAEKSGCIIKEFFDYKLFHALISHVLSKFDTKPVHTVQELELLASRFKNKIRLFGVFREGMLDAAVLIYDFGHVVHTQYMASSDNGRKIGALDYLLIWLCDLFAMDKKYLSFGISTESNGRILNEGLLRQKEGFGGRGLVHDFYELEL